MLLIIKVRRYSYEKIARYIANVCIVCFYVQQFNHTQHRIVNDECSPTTHSDGYDAVDWLWHKYVLTISL